MGTTSEKLTYLNTTKGKIKDSINLTGANITTEPFRQYSTKLEDAYIDIINNGTDTLYNNFPKVNSEGTSLTLNNTYQAPMRNNLKGNTSQTGTPTPTSPIPVNVVSGDNSIEICGKNLFNKNTVVDGYLNADGTIYDTLNYNTSDYIIVEPNTSYYKTATSSPRTKYYDKNKQPLNTTTYQDISIGGNEGTFTTPNNAKYLRFSYPIATVDANSIMLHKGTTASTYEPYQGNTYNIDLPMGINLYDFMNNTYNNEGNLTITKLSNGFILTNNSTNLGRIIFSNATVDSSKNYVISFEIDNPSGKLARLGWSGSSKTVETTATSGKITGVLTGITTSAFSIYIDGKSTITITNLMYYEGTDTSKSYEPYGTTPIELCKIGNYQDYFYKDSDKWYLYKAIGKVVLNGSENISSYVATSLSGSYQATFEITTKATSTDKIVLSDYFDSALTSDRTTKTNICYTFTDGLLRIATNLATTMANFKTWLSTNKPSVYYVLATPTNTEITDTTLINQLEELYIAKSKNNQTNISQINNDLGFIISASALKKG